jgi:hypothetical protein
MKINDKISVRKWFRSFVVEIAARLYAPEKETYTLDG